MKFSLIFSLLISSVFAQDLKPFLNKYCSDCHDSDLEEASFNIEKLDYSLKSSLSQKPWAYVYDMVSSGEMPPKKKKKQLTKKS